MSKSTLHILLSVLFFIPGLIQGQTRPDHFPVETDPTNSNFEFYTQKNGSARRSTMDAVANYIAPRIDAAPIAYTPAATGNPYADYRKFVIDPEGDLYYIDADGDGILVSAAAGFGGHVISDAGTAVADRDTLDFVDNDISFSVANTSTRTQVSGTIAADSVNSTHIQAGAVGNSELASNAVDSAKICAGCVSVTDIGQHGATSGQVPKWNGTQWAPADDNAVPAIPSPQIPYGNGSGITSEFGIKANTTAAGVSSDFKIRVSGENTNTYGGFAADSVDVGKYAFAASNNQDNSTDWYAQYLRRLDGAGDIISIIQHSNSGSVSDAIQQIVTVPSGGDPMLLFTAGSSNATIGIDNSESGDPLIIDYGGLIDGTYAVQVNSSNLVGIGGAAVTGKALTVTGEARISDLTVTSFTPNNIVAAESDGDLGRLKIGTGLSISNDTLHASATGVTGSGTNPAFPYWVSSTALGSSGAYWDNPNGRFGIGTASPNSTLHVTGTSPNSGNISNITGTVTSTTVYSTNSGLKVNPALSFGSNNQDLAGMTIEIAAPTVNGYTTQSSVGPMAIYASTTGNVSCFTGVQTQTSAAGSTLKRPFQLYQNGASNTSSMFYLVKQTSASGDYFEIIENRTSGSHRIIASYMNSAASNDTYQFIGTRFKYSYWAGTHVSLLDNTSNITGFRIETYDGGTKYPLIAYGKLVGINTGATTVPNAQLQVKGQGTTSGTFTGKYVNSNDSIIVAIRDDRTVGINKDAPGEALDVNGQVRADALDLRNWSASNNTNDGQLQYHNGSGGTHSAYLTIADGTRRFPVMPYTVQLQAVDYNVDWTTGRTKAFWTVPARFNGWKVSKVYLMVSTIGSTTGNTVEVEKGGVALATQTISAADHTVVLDETVSTSDIFTFDITSLGATASKGLLVEIELRYHE